MELFIAFGVFIAAMITAVVTGYSMIIALLIGLAAFLAVGKYRGFTLKSMAEMSKKGIVDSIVVIEVMLVIGALTAVWRASGTITIFVYYGMKIIMPPIFLIVTFVFNFRFGMSLKLCDRNFIWHSGNRRSYIYGSCKERRR